jgi:formylglycine-generating enzyme required for sulfatase activity
MRRLDPEVIREIAEILMRVPLNSNGNGRRALMFETFGLEYKWLGINFDGETLTFVLNLIDTLNDDIKPGISALVLLLEIVRDRHVSPTLKPQLDKLIEVINRAPMFVPMAPVETPPVASAPMQEAPVIEAQPPNSPSRIGDAASGETEVATVIEARTSNSPRWKKLMFVVAAGALLVLFLSVGSLASNNAFHPTPTNLPDEMVITSEAHSIDATATFTPTRTFPPSATPHPLELARNFRGRNRDWTPVVQTLVDDVEMVLVPVGCFMMGSANGAEDEKPVSAVCFDAPFWIDRYEVSNAQFAAFGGQAGRQSNWTDADRPRERITWSEANDFCENKRPGDARLPTEAEWEYAARGPSAWLYPWGDEFVADNVVYWRNSNGETASVSSKPEGASWVGALHMSGNVWEWVSSAYWRYPYDKNDGRENANDIISPRVLRGGSSLYDSFTALRAPNRARLGRALVDDLTGFRCARDYTEGDFVP